MALEIDLVRALREPEYRDEITTALQSGITDCVLLEAADEIERLRLMVQALSEERQHGALLTFMGVPIYEAARIIFAAKRDTP